ncbi:MAG: hypothetical protein NTW87_00975 [Planctomycetota bacterium]|nr:hypothetical protein [Planctomycetota bacterium]
MSAKLLYVCEICQTVLDEQHCEAICPNCGRTLDCSDLGLVRANAVFDDEHGITPCPGSDLRDFLPKAPDSGRQAGPAAPRAPESDVASLP